MEIRQLEYFRKIAQTGSINEAARQLNMSQPPLSYQLKLLEQELDVKLFERSRQGVSMTEAGKLLYQRSEELLQFADSTKLEVSHTGKRQVLRLGMTSTTVAPVLPKIAAFVQQHPEVSFEVHDGSTYSLLDLLLNGIIDVSVVRTPLQLEKVDHKVLFEEPMIAVSAPEDRSGGSIVLEELIGRPLILYRRYERFLLDAFHAKGLEPRVLCICDDARDAMQWAGQGLATAIFPKSMESLCTGLRIQPIREAALQTKILLIWRSGKAPRAIVREFLAVCDGSDTGCAAPEKEPAISL